MNRGEHDEVAAQLEQLHEDVTMALTVVDFAT